MSPKPVPVFPFPGETLPLALALLSFVGFMLILVVVLLSIWKMGRLLQHSCCPVVMLPDTLVTVLFPFNMMLTRCSLGLSGAGTHISWVYKHLHKAGRRVLIGIPSKSEGLGDVPSPGGGGLPQAPIRPLLLAPRSWHGQGSRCVAQPRRLCIPDVMHSLTLRTGLPSLLTSLPSL